METDRSIQSVVDNEHLKLLAIFHYIQGGLAAIYAFFPLIYACMGGLILLIDPSTKDSSEPVAQVIGCLFIGFGVFASFCIILVAALRLFAGRCISQRRHRVFCLVIAGLNCFCMPYGTILGVCTIMVLLSPSVEEQFSANK